MRLQTHLWTFEIHGDAMASMNDLQNWKVLAKKNIQFDNLSVNKM